MSRKYSGKFSSGTPEDRNPNNSADGSGQRKNKKAKRRIIWWVLLGILIFLLAMLVAASIFVVSKLNKINRVDPNETRISPEQAATVPDETDVPPDPSGSNAPIVNEQDVTLATVPEDDILIGESEEIVNILLIGQDRRPGEARARSDSMILVSFNKDANTITMVSFLRDNYVQIPGGYRDNRLNVAYNFGGMELLDEALEVNFGIYVDANIEVDFTGFTSVIDTLGGVDVYLTEAEADYLGGGLSAGMNHLSGDEALSYSRIRKLDSDFGRTNRQRNVLESLFNSFRNISLSDALNLADQLFPLLTTDMTNMEMIGYITELLPVLSAADGIESLHIPGDGNYYDATIRGMMVLVPDLNACREQLREALLNP